MSAFVAGIIRPQIPATVKINEKVKTTDALTTPSTLLERAGQKSKSPPSKSPVAVLLQEEACLPAVHNAEANTTNITPKIWIKKLDVDVDTPGSKIKKATKEGMKMLTRPERKNIVERSL